MRFLTPAAALSLLALGAPTLSAQVLVNEVNFEANEQWIELYNAGPSDISLGSWSIYHATKTANTFGDYWWGFPTTTTIKTQTYLRVHWGAPLQTNTATDLYTGDLSWNFLFGHGFEALDPNQGAIAVCKTKDNKVVNSASIFADWWQWGQTGFKREQIAVDNKPVGLWVQNATIPGPIPAGASLISLEFLHSFPRQITSFGPDFTPTPLAVNAAPIGTTIVDTPCGNKVPNIDLAAVGHPYHGNKSFDIVVNNTNGGLDLMFIVLNLTGNTFPFPPTSGCTVLDPTVGILAGPIGTNNGSTPFSSKMPLGDLMVLPSLRGITFHLQVAVFGDLPTKFESYSNKLTITVSQ